MRLLNSLLSLFKESQTASSPTSIDNRFVIPDGSIARFSFDKRDFFADGRPKPRIFSQEVHPETSRLETSVCGLNGVSQDRIWALGNSIRSPLAALAAVEVKVSDVIQLQLQCEAVPEDSYDEHGVIIGWSDNKDHRIAKSQDLIEKITEIKRPKVSN